LILFVLVVPISWSLAAETTTVVDDATASADKNAVITDVRVVIDAHPKRQATYAAMARRLITIHAGDRLTDTALQTALDALRLSHRFASIHVDADSDSSGEVLVFTLRPYRFIKDIRIRGSYPLFERNILNQMTLYPGDPYTREDLSVQTGAIVKLYQREGYPNPQVSIRAIEKPGEEYAVVFVDIDKGPHDVLDTLRVEGNQGISASALKWRMKVWRAALVPGVGRFSEFRLKKDMASLLTYYRKKGFADAELSYRIDEPVDSHRINVTVQVREGRRYRVAFQGNDRFWDLTLKKDVVIFTRGNRSNVGVRKSIQNMKARYREAGYLDTRIEAKTTDVAATPADLRRLSFVIQEGPRTLVDTITIAGNQAISESEIKNQLLTRPPEMFHDGAFVPDTLDEDAYAVTTLYMQQGFQERSVGSEVTFSEDRTVAEVLLTIEEGPQTRVRSIDVNGLTVLPQADARKALVHRIGDPFRQAALEAEKEAIASLVSEKGYPYVSVNASVTFSEDRTQADIVHDVDPGPQVTLGDIFIAGNIRTADKVIRRELKVLPQSPLSLRALHDGQRRLRDLDIFHGVSYRTFGLKEKEETVNLFVEVEENKPYYAQISGGYESDSGFFGRTKVGDQNLFGLNKDLWASGEISQTGYRLETRLTEPRLFGTQISASISMSPRRSVSAWKNGINSAWKHVPLILRKRFPVPFSSPHPTFAMTAGTLSCVPPRV
jgi:outer membrane protein insertion porin family